MTTKHFPIKVVYFRVAWLLQFEVYLWDLLVGPVQWILTYILGVIWKLKEMFPRFFLYKDPLALIKKNWAPPWSWKNFLRVPWLQIMTGFKFLSLTQWFPTTAPGTISAPWLVLKCSPKKLIFSIFYAKRDIDLNIRGYFWWFYSQVLPDL